MNAVERERERQEKKRLTTATTILQYAALVVCMDTVMLRYFCFQTNVKRLGMLIDQ
jgi:hypothetical protein